MSYELCGKVKDLIPYQPLSGYYKIRLDANESYILPPDYITDEMRTALSQVAFNRYPDPYAKGLCEAFADYYGIDSRQVTAGNGSDELIMVIIASLLDKGDKILTLSPDFSMYPFYAGICENTLVELKKDSELNITADEIINAANSENVRLIIFSNPCNPTAQGILKEDIKRIITSVNALVILDEAYMDFWNQSLIKDADEYDNLIVLRTASKAIGMASLRLGFAVACETLTNALRSAKSPYNVNSVSQLLGEIIYRKPEYLISCKKLVVKSRKNLYNKLSGIKGIKVFPSKTNFLIIELQDAKAAFEYLLSKSISVRLMGNYLRITAGSEEENSSLVFELENFIRGNN